MYDLNVLQNLIKTNDVVELKKYMSEHNLILKDNRIIPENTTEYKEQELFWNQRQQARKILLNSLYGAILNSTFRLFDPRIGQSVTITGRSITRHMGSTVNEILTGEYLLDGKAKLYGDTDSVSADAIIETSSGKVTIEQLFLQGAIHWADGEKEYSCKHTDNVLSYDPTTNQAVFASINYVYRHKVLKNKWKITDIFSNEVTITEDHSVMIEREGKLLEVKPNNIEENDLLISVNKKIIKEKVVSIEHLGNFQDEYVYDIGVEKTPYFFANNILVHNSIMFSAYKIPGIFNEKTSKEEVIELYDAVADAVNDTFPSFMNKAFNTGLERGSIIKAGREYVAIQGIFIKKKRYAVLMFDKEGTRLDTDDKPGKIKAMGLDLKRSDTPKVMQKFLEEILIKVLTGSQSAIIIEMIKGFRKKFRALVGYQKGTPKKTNNVIDYNKKITTGSKAILASGRSAKVKVPGHIQAALNWNMLIKINNDHYSLPITDGNKVIVCRLLSNSYNIKNIAYPIDQPHLPEWFKKLPFDDEEMEKAIIDQKIENLIGVLKWDLSDAEDRNTFNDLFG